MKFFYKKIILSILLMALTIFIYLNFTKPIEINSHVNKESKFYINDIYSSNGRIYNNYLSEEEKKIYNLLIENILKRNANFKYNPSDYNCKSNKCVNEMLTANEAIMIDNPEIINYASFSMEMKDKINTVTLYYAIRFKFLEPLGEAYILRKIDDIKKETKDLSDLDKIKYVYNWINQNAKYDTLFTSDSKNQSIYNVFLKHNAVCAGFAKTSQVIFQNIGINSFLVINNNHMWNIIEYNGKYYYYDSTVASSLKSNNSHYYDGLTQSYFKNKWIKHENWYPKVSAEEIFFN